MATASWVQGGSLQSAELPREQAARVARGNDIALGVIARADALRAGRHDELPALAARFAAAGCPYQERRTKHVAERGAGRAFS